MKDEAASAFLIRLDERAAARAAAALSVPKKDRCRNCSGTGSRIKYVLPGVTGPAQCITCMGSGRAP